MKYEELNHIIFGDLLKDENQNIDSKSSKRVKLIIDKSIYIITGFRKDKYYITIIPMIYQGAKPFNKEWNPGDNIFEFIKKLKKKELIKTKKSA